MSIRTLAMKVVAGRENSSLERALRIRDIIFGLLNLVTIFTISSCVTVPLSSMNFSSPSAFERSDSWDSSKKSFSYM